MRTIAKMFGRSPFVPLQSHMQKVSECVERVPDLFEAYARGDEETIAKLAKQVSKLEHDADLIKHDIRDNLPRGLFLPIDRANLLGILSTQDGIADRVENIAVLLTFGIAKRVDPLPAMFDSLVAKSLEAFDTVRGIIDELDELLESGFGGVEAQKVREMVDLVALREHEADVLQRDLVRELLRHTEELSYADFYLWTRIIRQIAQVADRSENLAMTIRTILESK